MRIENSFSLDAPMDLAWLFLTDIPTVASCVPGVGLTREVDGVYSGSVKSKVGPVTAEYRSSATLVACDESQRRVVLQANGHDSRTEENVHMLVSAELRSVGDTTHVAVSTDVSGTGKVAQLGRGVLQSASEKLLAQFVSCLSAKIDDHVARSDVDGTAALLEPTLLSTGPTTASTSDHDPLDLLSAAGGALAKRLAPVAIVLLVIVIVLLVML